SLSRVTDATIPPMIISPTTTIRMKEMAIPVTVANTYLKNDFISFFLVSKLSQTWLYMQVKRLLSFDEGKQKKLRSVLHRTTIMSPKFILFCTFTAPKKSARLHERRNESHS